jgi:hypothetical protein
MLDKLAPPVEETAREAIEAWINAFGATLVCGDEGAITGLSADNAHWRNLFGLPWHFATIAGNNGIAGELLPADIARFEGNGLRLKDGSTLQQGRLAKNIETRVEAQG